MHTLTPGSDTGGKKMLIHVINEGDASVGLPGDYATVELNDALLVDDPDDREYLRDGLQELFSTFFDQVDTYVIFDDEENTR